MKRIGKVSGRVCLSKTKTCIIFFNVSPKSNTDRKVIGENVLHQERQENRRNTICSCYSRKPLRFSLNSERNRTHAKLQQSGYEDWTGDRETRRFSEQANVHTAVRGKRMAGYTRPAGTPQRRASLQRGRGQTRPKDEDRSSVDRRCLERPSGGRCGGRKTDKHINSQAFSGTLALS